MGIAAAGWVGTRAASARMHAMDVVGLWQGVQLCCAALDAMPAASSPLGVDVEPTPAHTFDTAIGGMAQLAPAARSQVPTMLLVFRAPACHSLLDEVSMLLQSPALKSLMVMEWEAVVVVSGGMSGVGAELGQSSARDPCAAPCAQVPDRDILGSRVQQAWEQPRLWAGGVLDGDPAKQTGTRAYGIRQGRKSRTSRVLGLPLPIGASLCAPGRPQAVCFLHAAALVVLAVRVRRCEP